MSMDTADDLQYAEDTITALTEQLREAVAILAGYGVPNDLSGFRAAIAAAADYCRPTCRWRDEGECAEGDTCGCLCGHEGGSA